MAKVTIVASVYGVASYLEHFIKSMKSQTFKDFVVYFVNDGTKDNSIDVINQFSSDDSRFKYIHVNSEGEAFLFDHPQNCEDAANYGIYATRNTALKFIDTEYFTFHDPDDWIDNQYFERLVAEADSTQADLTKAELCRDYDDGRCIPTLKNEKIRRLINKEWPVSIQLCGSQAITCLFRTGIAKQYDMRFKSRVDGFEFDSDDLFLLEYALRSKSFAFCDDVFYHYYQRTASAVHVINEKRFVSTVCCRQLEIELLNSFVSENAIDDKSYALIALRIIWELAKHYRIYLNSDKFSTTDYLCGCAEILKIVKWNSYINQSTLSFFKPLLAGKLDKAGNCMTNKVMIGLDKIRLMQYGI